MKFNFIRTCLVSLLVVSPWAMAQNNIKVYAASSMTNAIQDIAKQFEAKNKIHITPVFASSSSLARQINNGAPADVFISANVKWMTYLEKEKVVQKAQTITMAHNSLVVIAPKDENTQAFNIEKLSSWTKTLGDLRLAVGNTDAVPAGIYAKESLTAMKLWSGLADHLAPAKNVRLALALVERGEAPLGIVYKTDAKLSKKVQIVAEFAPSTHTKISYPAAPVTQSKAAKQFITYLQSPAAQTVLTAYGFSK